MSEPIWMAVIISASVGLPGEEPLRYSDVDADEIAAALVELGPFAPDNVIRVSASRRDAVTDALSSAVLRASRLGEQGRSTRLLLYYTGHASAEGIHLGGEVMSLESLKTAARVVPARERVFAIDACQSGSLFRSKGATLVAVDAAPPHFTPPEDEAWITSSGAEELAFEVDQRRGSLFSHFFVSGLRGAADADRSATVTLGELFAFVQRQTSSAAASVGQRQQPRWSTDLTDLVVSTPAPSRGGFEVVGPVAEPVLVVSHQTAEVIAEVPVGAGSFLSVPAGRYQLMALGDERYRVGDVTVQAGAVQTVHVTEELASTSGVRSKGGLVTPRPWRVSAGVQTTAGFAPGHGVAVGPALRVDRAMGRGHDLGFGLAGLTGQVENPQARVRTDRVDAALDWSYDVTWRHVRWGPGVRAGAGWVQQRGERREDGPWGDWDGEYEAVTQVRAVSPTVAGLLRVAVPLGEAVELAAHAGAGVRTEWRPEPAAHPFGQASLELGWALR